jgi:hypothetical protein
LSAIAAGALLAGLAAGGGGSGAGSGLSAKPSGASPGSRAGLANASNELPGAPVTQAHGYGVETDFCPLAPPNRYPPARSGCVTVRRADLNGDGRQDLIIVYSTLNHERPSGYDNEPVPARRSRRGDLPRVFRHHGQPRQIYRSDGLGCAS